VLATMLKDAGANVSVALGALNDQGDTPLLAAVTVGNLELAELLVSWGADVRAQRRGGAGLIALAIHSKRPDSISLCPAPRPRAHRIAEHFRCPRLCAGVRVSAQHPEMASRWCVPPDTRARDRGPATASRGGCWQARTGTTNF
jgi:hypothetical protein